MQKKSFRKLFYLLMTLVLLIGIVGCSPAAEEPAAEEPMAGGTSITMLIPEDPVALNGIVTDTGYEQLIGELVLLSVAEIDLV